MAGLKIGKMVMRSLFGKPATLMYPVVPREWKERTRGRIEIEIENCIFCGICSRKCPTDAITVDRGAGTWTIRRMGCIQCSCCVETCPKGCLTNVAGYTTPDVIKIEDTFTKPEEAPKEAAAPAEEPEAAPAEEPEADDAPQEGAL
ncbi:MAG: 4Fe-4S dicluster domain-containing protein [Clostridiales Family XIII bacterium]|jgi:formate hydrogenlyase subunit 6/NADH:ubiquinone oxidoreductase subunit I|nr:4Fe-4S dicluster domain-containing protein [Clostridiales Family XIII bacterium]